MPVRPMERVFGVTITLAFVGALNYGMAAEQGLHITGNDGPIIKDLPQQFTCIAPSVGRIEWRYRFFGIVFTLESANGVNELALDYNPSSVGMFRFFCNFTSYTGETYEVEVHFVVEELHHEVNVTSSNSGPGPAGEVTALTCMSTSNLVPQLRWEGPNGPVSSGDGITIHQLQKNNNAVTSVLVFSPLRTSHAGAYTCISNVENGFSVNKSTISLHVQIPEPAVHIVHEDIPVTSQGHFRILYVIEVDSTVVDTPITVEVTWGGNPSVSDSPRVAIAPPTVVPPYTTSITFTSLVSSDFGEYQIQVVVVPLSGQVVRRSPDLLYRFNFSAKLLQMVIDPQTMTTNETGCSVSNGGCEHLCVDTENGPECHCVPGYNTEGKMCTDINECAFENGGCNHTCINTAGSYHCQCQEGFVLAQDERACSDIDECSEGLHSCEQTCVNTPGSFSCSCLAGYILSDSEEYCADIDECKENTHTCNHVCTNTPGSYLCGCFNCSYELATDKRTCQDVNECTTGTHNCDQTCNNEYGYFSCSCKSGFTLAPDGKTCNDVIECSIGNGGCQHICINTPGSHVCTCRTGYRLSENQRTCEDIDECSENTHGCNEHSRCINTPGSFTCYCDAGFTPSTNGNCIDINECTEGAHDCDHTCTNNEGSYTCSCSRGYSLAGDGKSCTAVCGAGCVNGRCTAPNTCTCYPRWTGSSCATATCRQACGNGGRCTAPNFCTCASGWSGASCEIAICEPQCVNGRCTRPNSCTCSSGWRGSTCNTAICEQGCVNGMCSAPNKCTCTAGWIGSSCNQFTCSNCCVHGRCTGPNRCTCDSGWTGSTCSSQISTSTCSRCVNGRCIANRCACDFGWTGSACDQNSLAECPTNSQGERECP